MTLPSAPSAISFNDISLELFCNVQSYNLNDQYGRCIACVPTPQSQISLSNFYGKSAAVTTLATCMCGGWYMGCTTACGVNYYLIVAPADGGYQWDYARGWAPGTLPALPPPSPVSCLCANLPVFSPGPIGCNPVASYDGYCLTKFIQTCPNYNPSAPLPAGVTFNYPLTNKITAMTLGGYSDWYFPSGNELNTMYCNSDLAWKCGSNMKTSGNMFPATAPLAFAAVPPAAGAPGCWPYLGYTSWGGPTPSIPAPGSYYVFGFSRGNPWNPCFNSPTYNCQACCWFQVNLIIPGGLYGNPCLPSNLNGELVSSTQATGQPQSLYPTGTGTTLKIGFGFRFFCSNCAAPVPGTFPAVTAWCGITGRACRYLTRAVRRVAI
jgi:hypothetical protein